MICGAAACIERTINDYGPQDEARLIDLYKPDFFLGSHQFKAGGSLNLNKFARAYPGNEDSPKYNFQLVFNRDGVMLFRRVGATG